MAYIQDWGMRVQAQPQINTTRRAFLHLSQNENGRMLNIRITDVNIPAGSTAVLAGTKPDGTVYSQTGTLSGNTATFAEDVQMTAVAGTWDAKITVTNGGNCICTARITITIDPDTVAGGAIPSDSQLDGIIAECRAIADSVRKEAYGSPLVADAVEDMTDQSRVYVYTGSESGMTAGHWYYYNGTAWSDGGVYNAVAVDTDTTLTIAGKAADAKEVGDQLTSVKEDLSNERFYLNEKCSTYTNAFNPQKLDDASGIKCGDGVYVGTNTAFGAVGAIPVSCETGKQYTLSFDYYAEENTSTGRGLSFVITYSNDSVDSVDLLNTASTLTHLSFTTDANKTVVSITPTARTGTGNVFHVKNIMLAEGTTEKSYSPYYIPNDIYARNRINEIEGCFDSIAVNYYDKDTFTANKVINGTGTSMSTSAGNGFMGFVHFKPKAGVYCCFINGVPARNKVQIYLFKNNALGSESFITRYIPTKDLSAFYITPAVATQCNYLAINLMSSKFDTGETAASVNNAMMMICLDDIKVNVPYTSYGELFRKNSNSEYIKDKSVYLGRWHFDNKFQCVAYSGSKNGYPPNTRESYEGYAIAGFDGVKGDVRVTSDNKLVMCHDPGFTFDENGRITTYNASDATAIIDMTFDDVMELEYAMKPEGADYVHPATPEDLIQVCKRHGKTPYITIRNDKIPDVVAPAIYNLLKKYNIVGNTIINCVTLDPLFSMRALDDDLTLSYIAPYDVDPTALENVYFANALGNCQLGLYIADGYSMTKADLEAKISARSDLLELCDSLGVRKAIGQIGNNDCLDLSFNSAFGLAQTTVMFT